MKGKSSREEGIKVREFPFRESDVFIDIFSRRGTLRCLARGLKRSRKRFPGSVRKFCIYSFRVSKGKGDLHTLLGASYIDGFEEIGEDLRRYCCGDYIIEILSRFYLEDMDSSYIFDSLTQFLRVLARGGDLYSSVKWMEIRILNDSGFFPDFGRCSSCSELFSPKDIAYFHDRYASIICIKCKKPSNYSILHDSVRVSLRSALDLECGDFSLDISSGRRLFDRVVTGTVISRLGFVPKSLGKMV